MRERPRCLPALKCTVPTKWEKKVPSSTPEQIQQLQRFADGYGGRATPRRCLYCAKTFIRWFSFSIFGKKRKFCCTGTENNGAVPPCASKE
jgi:hypothetical protein